MCYYGYILWACGCAPDNQMRVPTTLSCLENGDCTLSRSLGNLDGSLDRDGKLRLNYICPNCQYINGNPEYDPPEPARTDTGQSRTPQYISNSDDDSRGPSRQRRTQQFRGTRYRSDSSNRPSRETSSQQSHTSRNSNNSQDSRPSSHRTGNDPTRIPRHRPDRTTTSSRQRRQAQEDEEDEEYERAMRSYRAEAAAITRRRDELLRELERRDTERGSRTLIQRYREGQGGNDRNRCVHSRSSDRSRSERLRGDDRRSQAGDHSRDADRVRYATSSRSPEYVWERIVDEWEEVWDEPWH